MENAINPEGVEQIVLDEHNPLLCEVKIGSEERDEE
jgi:hypothetical protein